MTDETPDDTASYGLVLSFSGLYQTMPEEHAFVHGVEFGGLWARMWAGTEAEIEETVHATNRQIIERAAASQNWTCQFKLTDYPEWQVVAMTKCGVAKNNPHGLRVVAN
jgi:hypothetical protein